MQFELNTDTKTIIIKGKINVVELYDALHSLGINSADWTIEGETIFIKSDPIIIPDPNPWIQPVIPWVQPYVPQIHPYYIGDPPGWLQPTITCLVRT